MHFRPAYLIALIPLSVAITSAKAEVLQMPESTPAQQAGESISIELPIRGMSMETVESRFGAPNQKMAPVGDPPITRWVYDNYTVYFEYKTVIHSVLNR